MTYKETLEQIEALKREAEAKRRDELSAVIGQIKTQMAEHGITVADLQPNKPRAKIAPKYRDEAGNTWTGRGKMPRWLTQAVDNGRQARDFLIAS